MSKLKCKCGHLIVDQTDSLPYKASLLRDQAEDSFWNAVGHELQTLMRAVESVDQAAVADEYGKFAPWVSAADELQSRIVSLHVRHMSAVYECANCGRLWLQRDASQEFFSYAPDEGGCRGILASASDDSPEPD